DVSVTTGKALLEKMLTTDRFPREIIQEEGLSRVSDRNRLEEIVARVMEDSPEEVSRYRSGNKNLLGYFMGQVMKMTKGKSDPQVVRSLLLETLEGN
ncbi:MAG: Asp-tRNA(Asn)/Glu-tRNA(Gln) amidotransferase GatCAB subunit B, partial [Fidelibacterota bacterium]